MKKYLVPAVVVLSFAMTTLCLFRISSLEDRLQGMQNNLSNQIHSVEASVDGISSTVRSLLEEQASILSGNSFTYGALDTNAMTIDIVCSITPKEFSPEKTTASLVWDELEIPLTLQNGSFVATFPVSLFSTLEEAKVLLLEDEVLRTAALPWFFSPQQDLLPEVNATFNSSASGTNEYRLHGQVEIDVTGKQELIKVGSITLIEKLDGKEISRRSIPVEPLSEQNAVSFYGASFEINETYKIPNGSTHDLVVEVVDHYGLHHRILIDRWIVDQNGNLASDPNEWRWRGAGAEICDATGRVLYKAEDFQ